VAGGSTLPADRESLSAGFSFFFIRLSYKVVEFISKNSGAYNDKNSPFFIFGSKGKNALFYT
jgi:hypothetical protein